MQLGVRGGSKAREEPESWRDLFLEDEQAPVEIWRGVVPLALWVFQDESVEQGSQRSDGVFVVVGVGLCLLCIDALEAIAKSIENKGENAFAFQANTTQRDGGLHSDFFGFMGVV